MITTTWFNHFDRRTPPLWGGSYLLCSLLKNREEEDQFWGWFFRGGPLPPGSWSGNIVNRKPPRGGGVLSINLMQHGDTCCIMCVCVCACVYVCVCACVRACVCVCVCTCCIMSCPHNTHHWNEAIIFLQMKTWYFAHTSWKVWAYNHNFVIRATWYTHNMGWLWLVGSITL